MASGSRRASAASESAERMWRRVKFVSDSSNVTMIVRTVSAALMVLCLTMTGYAQGDPVYGFGYEFELEVDGSRYSVQTTAQIQTGGVISHDFGTYRLDVRLREVIGSSLLLSVRVTDLKSDVQIDGGILSGDHTIALNSISEIETLSESAVFRAAIGVGTLGR